MLMQRSFLDRATPQEERDRTASERGYRLAEEGYCWKEAEITKLKDRYNLLVVYKISDDEYTLGVRQIRLMPMEV